MGKFVETGLASRLLYRMGSFSVDISIKGMARDDISGTPFGTPPPTGERSESSTVQGVVCWRNAHSGHNSEKY